MITTDLKTAPDLLEEAAALIEEHGHRRYVLGSVRDGFCVAGALNVAHHGGSYYDTDEGDEWNRAFVALAAELHLVYDEGVEGDVWSTAVNVVVSWNNREGRTGDEVTDACRRAAAALRASDDADTPPPTDTEDA